MGDTYDEKTDYGEVGKARVRPLSQAQAELLRLNPRRVAWFFDKYRDKGFAYMDIYARLCMHFTGRGLDPPSLAKVDEILRAVDEGYGDDA